MFGMKGAFKPRQHYVFNYTPRYYNERKERLEKLKEKYESKENSHIDIENDVTITFSKNNLKSAWKRTKKSPSDYRSTRRLAIIITILVGIVAYIFELHKLI